MICAIRNRLTNARIMNLGVPNITIQTKVTKSCFSSVEHDSVCETLSGEQVTGQRTLGIVLMQTKPKTFDNSDERHTRGLSTECSFLKLVLW